ncbi:MAG: putative periplasmic sensor histidine kinase, partial [Candidatus Midichloriaceae bacterium]|nr:putative periplasmic sensor histidine kinase [Candidatus Midichloriaceae bacterium]
MNNLHTIDIAVIIGYLILCLVIGLYKAGKIKTIREYTLGTGYISTTVLIFTIFATFIGAGATVGTVEKIHSMGLIFAVTLLLQPFFWILTAKLFASKIDIFKKAGCMSVSDIMEVLYGTPGKWAANILSIFFGISFIAMQVMAIGYLFNYFLGISHFIGILIGFGVLVVYSLFGGIRAVALTDTFQGLILLVAIPVACAMAFHDIGGHEKLIAGLPSTHLSIDFNRDNMLLLAGMAFYMLLPISEGTFMQRFLMANDSKQLNKALMMLAYISLPFALIICLIGFVIKVKAPEINPNIAFFYLIDQYVPIGITGLLISGILAAIMSTADSWLNTTSILCAHDIAKGLFPKLTDKQELLIARISVLIIAALSATLALIGKGVMELEWLAGNFWQPIILIPLIAGFMMFQTNYTSFIGSSILGALGVFLGGYIAGEFATISILFGMIGCAIGLFGMHYWQVLTNKQIGGNTFSQYTQINIYKTKKNYLKLFVKQIKKQASKYQDYCYPLGALGMVYFLGSSFFMVFTDAKILHTIVYLKAAAAVLCFGLCIYEFHLNSKYQRKYMPIYWIGTLVYCFPFLSSYIALIYNFSMPWMINLMLSTMLLYIFSGWIPTIVLSIIGFSAASLLFKITGYSLATLNIEEQPQTLGYIYCFLTGAIILILKHRDALQEKELEGKMLYGAAVAHEVINPLQSASMMADTLLKAFKNKKFEEVNKEDFEDIKELLEPFKQNTQAALKTVDRMLTLVRTDISEADDIGDYNITDCVEDTLKSYGLSEQR